MDKKTKRIDPDDIQGVDPGNLNITSIRGKHEKKRREKISKEEKALIRKKKREERRQKALKRKEEKRLARERRKKEKLRLRPVLYDPENVESFERSVVLGFALRFFAIAFSVFGVCYMFCDAFAMTPSTSASGEGVVGILLLLFCYAMTCAFSLIFMGKMLSLAGIGILAFTVIMILVLTGDPIAFFLGGFESVLIHAMYIIDSHGFASAEIVLGLPSLADESASLFGGIASVATVLCLIFSAFSARRTRIFPMLIAGGAMCALCFSYNFSNSNLGIAFTLAGLCATIVLATHDKLYAKLKKSKKSRAFSGYSSALAGILALIIAIMPAVSVSKPFKEIAFLTEPMETARAYFMTLLTGGNPKNNVMNSLNSEKAVDLTAPEFTDSLLFTVKSHSSKNIYLRSWIADDYNDKNDSWSVLNEEDFDDLRSDLHGSYTDRNFTGDEVTYRLYELFAGDIAGQLIAQDKDSEPKTTMAQYNRGYVASLVDIEYVENSGLLYVLPSAFVPSSGLLEFESKYKRYTQDFSIYSDGMYQSSWFNLFKEYTALAIIQDYTTAEYGENTEKLIAYYKAIGDFILYEASKYQTVEEAVTAFHARLAELDLFKTFVQDKTLLEYLETPSADKLDWFRRYYTSISAYTEHVNEKYLKTSQNAGVKQTAEELKEDFLYNLEVRSTHDAIMTVIKHLARNYQYSTTPAQPSGEYESDLDAFLLETKEGYCVQFATAAALILRELGMPARYVQGYIATDGEKTLVDNGSDVKYVYDVYDDQAHAWIEVYIEGLGWRTYETTPQYYDSMYYKASNLFPEDTTAPTDTTTPPETTTTIPEEETTVPDVDVEDTPTPEEPKFEMDWEQFFKSLSVIALVLILFFFVRHKVKIANRIHDNRKYFIQRAIYGTFEDKADMDLIAITVGDCIYDVLSVAGFERKLGEMPSEFAQRIDNDPMPESKSKKKLWKRRKMLSKSMSEISALISKQEFGNGVSREELDVLGTYLQERIKIEYKALSPIKKIWYRYIKYMI